MGGSVGGGGGLRLINIAQRQCHVSRSKKTTTTWDLFRELRETNTTVWGEEVDGTEHRWKIQNQDGINHDCLFSVFEALFPCCWLILLLSCSHCEDGVMFSFGFLFPLRELNHLTVWVCFVGFFCSISQQLKLKPLPLCATQFPSFFFYLLFFWIKKKTWVGENSSRSSASTQVQRWVCSISDSPPGLQPLLVVQEGLVLHGLWFPGEHIFEVLLPLVGFFVSLGCSSTPQLPFRGK